MFQSAHRKRSVKHKQKFYSAGNSKLRLGLITLFLLILLVVFGKFLSLITSLSGPFAPDGPVEKYYSWNGKGLLNIAVKGDSIYLFSFNPTDKTVTLLKIPDDTYLDVPLGYGLWPARSVYDLGQAEKPIFGAKLLKETLSNTLGIGIDGYLILNNDLATISLSEEVKDLKDNPVEIFNLLGNSKTDLSLQELSGLMMALRNVRTDKITEVDLGSSNLTTSRLLSDGTRGLAFDQLQVDEFMQTKLTDALIKNEELNVGIYNATDHPGLAEKAARLIGNMGGRVVFTTNSKEKLQQSIVLGNPSYTEVRLSSVFAPQCLKSTPIYQKFFTKDDPCSCKSCNADTSRADVNVFLGESFFQKMIQK